MDDRKIIGANPEKIAMLFVELEQDLMGIIVTQLERIPEVADPGSERSGEFVERVKHNTVEQKTRIDSSQEGALEGSDGRRGRRNCLSTKTRKQGNANAEEDNRRLQIPVLIFVSSYSFYLCNLLLLNSSPLSLLSSLHFSVLILIFSRFPSIYRGLALNPACDVRPITSSKHI